MTYSAHTLNRTNNHILHKLLFLSILVFICLFNTSPLHSQSSTRNKFFEADYALQLYDYETALKLFLQLQKRDTENAMYNYRIGQCYINLPGKKRMSLPYLEKAVQSVSENFKDGSYSETNAPVETYYLLAKAHHVYENLDDAIYYYNKFLPYAKDNALRIRVNNQIKACDYAKILINDPVGFETEMLGAEINSGSSEIYPVISEDESVLFYLVQEKSRNTVYYTKKEGQAWTTPKNINSSIGSLGDAFPSSISSDKQRLYLTLKDFFTSDIGVSTYVKGRWTRLKELKKPVNTKSWDSHAFESADGNELFFVSDRKGGTGMLDIYRTVKNSKGNWDKPVNLGPAINTPLNEIMPIISPDGEQLYFCSEGHSSIGGYDVFFSVKTGENSWSEPVNLGYPINTTDDNVYFRPVKEGIFAYTSFTQPEDMSNYDIYRIEIFSEKNPKSILLKGSLAMENNFSYFDDCRIAVIDNAINDTVERIYPDVVSGDYQHIITAGNYRIVFLKNEYKEYSEDLYIAYNHPEPVIEINPKFEKLTEEILLAEQSHGPEDEPAIITPEMDPAYEQSAGISQEIKYEEPSYFEDDISYAQTVPDKEPENEIMTTEEPAYNSYENSKSVSAISYTIQIMALKNPVRADFFKNIDNITVQIGDDGFYRYITGQFDNIDDAKYYLEELSVYNFPGAFIRKLDLPKYINEHYKTSSRSADNINFNSLKDYYTIQVMALRNPVAVSYFRNLDNIKISYGKDKIFRYTYNKYSSFEYANAEINKIRNIGYKEAFVRTISDISNY